MINIMEIMVNIQEGSMAFLVREYKALVWFVIALAAILFAAAIFIFLRFGEFPIGAGMDDAYYIETARSLAEGRGPIIHLNDSGPGWRPDIFPLGFPLLLSPLALLMPSSVNIFKLIPLMAMAALVPICLMMVRPAGVRRGLVLVALVCLNPWEIAFSIRVFSDLPFTAVSLAAVLLFLNLENDSRHRARQFVALVIVTGAAVMIRSVGLALVVAMAGHWLGHRQWRRALLFCGGVAVILLPHALASGGEGGGFFTRAYVDQVLGGDNSGGWRISLVAGNLLGYLKELPVVLLPVFGNPLENLAARIAAASNGPAVVNSTATVFPTAPTSPSTWLLNATSNATPNVSSSSRIVTVWAFVEPIEAVPSEILVSSSSIVSSDSSRSSPTIAISTDLVVPSGSKVSKVTVSVA